MRHAFAAALGALAVLIASAAHAGVFDGTWRADQNTIRLVASGKPTVIRVQDGQYVCTTCAPPLAVRADGTDQPANGTPQFDTVSITILDERTVLEIMKRAGRSVAVHKFTVSKDGGSAISEVSAVAAGSGAEVTRHQSYTRLTAGPPGSHAVSGSWAPGQPPFQAGPASVTIRVAGESLALRTSAGHSYAAPLNGNDAPYSGDPEIDSVSVRRTPGGFEETDKKAGRAVRTWHWTFDAGGRTGRLTLKDLATQSAAQAVVHKVE